MEEAAKCPSDLLGFGRVPVPSAPGGELNRPATVTALTL